MNKGSRYSFSNFSGWKTCFLAAFAILFGGLIYIFLRSPDHLFNNWIRTPGSGTWFNSIRHHFVSKSLVVPEWIVFSLPNGFWAFAYSLLITTIWSASQSRLKYFWMASIPVLIIGFEIFQATGVIHGTFCIQDITFGLAGLVLGITAGNKIVKSNNHERKIE